MSKPDKPGELRDVDVQAISMVSRAANGEKFKVFKSEKEAPETSAPEVVEKDERGLFRTLKEFFTGEKAEKVEKGAVADVLNAQDRGQRLGRAVDALFQVLGLNRWGETNGDAEANPSQIRAAINDFKAVAEEILLGKDDDVKKAVSELRKSGRKISGSRLAQLKNMQAILNDVLNGLDDSEDMPKEAEELTKEEVQKAVDEAVGKINIEEALQKALSPVLERIEKIEKARGISNRVPEDSPVQKSGDDFWGGIF